MPEHQPTLIERTPWGRTDKATRHAARTIAVMHQRHGKAVDTALTCGRCAHFGEVRMANTYYKCRAFGDTASAATDWRKSWPACGNFEYRQEDQ